jgi:hypothetical protein
VIGSHVSGFSIAPPIFESIYWAVLVSIPYGEDLDRLLDGAVSKGGSSSGSFGQEIPRHIEEPTSAFSRATYGFMLPLLFRHYYNPIKLHDIPSIREDDSAAASLGAFRAFQAGRDRRYSEKHGGQPRKRNLGIDLLLHFLPETLTQCVS